MNFDWGTIFQIQFNLAFFMAMLNIIFINIILSGDNAVLIAMAVRHLPPQNRMKGIAFGTSLAVVLRIVLTFFVALLMAVSFLKIVGGLLILWIAVKLLTEGDGDGNVAGTTSLWKAIQVILIADLTMSVDNVLAVAGAAGGNLPLLIFGLCLSIPIVVFASRMLSNLMERYPVIVVIGAAILGRVGADMLITDPAMERWLHPTTAMVYFIQGLGMMGVVLAGKYIKNRRTISVAEESIPEPSGIRLEKELAQP